MRFYALFNGQSVATEGTFEVLRRALCFYALFNGQSVATKISVIVFRQFKKVSMPFLTGSLLQLGENEIEIYDLEKFLCPF